MLHMYHYWHNFPYLEVIVVNILKPFPRPFAFRALSLQSCNSSCSQPARISYIILRIRSSMPPITIANNTTTSLTTVGHNRARTFFCCSSQQPAATLPTVSWHGKAWTLAWGFICLHCCLRSFVVVVFAVFFFFVEAATLLWLDGGRWCLVTPL